MPALGRRYPRVWQTRRGLLKPWSSLRRQACSVHAGKNNVFLFFFLLTMITLSDKISLSQV